jgi:succinate dehydrogenase / fumarate reductase iron-sulfur subunit
MMMATATAEEEAKTASKPSYIPPREVVIRTSRWLPSVGGKPTVREFKVPYSPGMTVLDALLYVKENLDASLSFRYSCRMGICGSCGMLINGRPMLACETQIKELPPGPIETEPLANYDTVRDLAADFTDFFAHHRFAKPYLVRSDKDEQEKPTKQYPQTERDRLKYLQFSYCIMCGLCDAACPPVAMDPEYLGPSRPRTDGWRTPGTRAVQRGARGSTTNTGAGSVMSP